MECASGDGTGGFYCSHLRAVSLEQPLLVSSSARASAGAPGLGIPWRILHWNKLLSCLWKWWVGSFKPGIPAEWNQEFFCWDILLLPSMPDNNRFWWFFGLFAHPGATQSLWQLNPLSAGGYTCKYLTLAVFPEEHWNIFPSAWVHFYPNISRSPRRE